MTASTLSELTSPAHVNWNILHQKYNPVLGLVNELIGVIPNCDKVLEIWPPGFRTYNLLVPNLLNLPNTLWSGKRLKAVMGLAMYASSAAAGCPYCTAHTCSFALRRGAAEKAILGERNAAEAAAVLVAEAMSGVPATLSKEHVAELKKHFNDDDAQQIVLAVCLMGFLNKFMDAMGIELEEESVASVGKLLAGTGWNPQRHLREQFQVPQEAIASASDNFFTYLRVARHAPGAINLERKWLKGIPHSADAAVFLKQKTGSDFQLLQKIKKPRAIKAITAVLRDNLDESTTTIGIRVKCLAAMVFASVVKNEPLLREIKLMCDHFQVRYQHAAAAIEPIVLTAVPADKQSYQEMSVRLQQYFSDEEIPLMMLARASAGSPAEVNEIIISEAAQKLLPQQIVELMVWISVQQMLHRLHVFFALS